MGGETRVLAGTAVSDTPLITRALDYARDYSEPVLLNHAVRSRLFAVRLGQPQGEGLRLAESEAPPFSVAYLLKPTATLRSDLNAARTSATNSSGCSHAAKCPPLSSLL